VLLLVQNHFFLSDADEVPLLLLFGLAFHVDALVQVRGHARAHAIARASVGAGVQARADRGHHIVGASWVFARAGRDRSAEVALTDLTVLPQHLRLAQIHICVIVLTVS